MAKCAILKKNRGERFKALTAVFSKKKVVRFGVKWLQRKEMPLETIGVPLIPKTIRQTTFKPKPTITWKHWKAVVTSGST